MPFIRKVCVLFKTRLIFPHINGPNVSQIHTKKPKFLTLAKKTWSIIEFGCYSCLLTYFNFWTLSPINLFRKYPKYRPTFYWGSIGLNPLPLWKFQFTFMLSFRKFGLLEKILRLSVIIMSMLIKYVKWVDLLHLTVYFSSVSSLLGLQTIYCEKSKHIPRGWIQLQHREDQRELF